MEPAFSQEGIRELSAGTEVIVELDPEPGREGSSFAARVEAVHSSSVRLEPMDQLPADVVARLRPEALGELTFMREAAPAALRGIVVTHRYSSHELKFVVAEAIRLRDRRSANRMPFVAPVRASLMADDGRVVGTTSATATKNLSLGGALVARRPILGSGPRWTIELTLPTASAPVQCEAVLARETSGYLALKFVNLRDSDRRLLATALVADEA
jgi:hypothetical protein